MTKFRYNCPQACYAFFRMRRVRWLLLTVLVVLILAVTAAFHFQRKQRQKQVVSPPAPLAERLSAAAQDWSYTQMDGDRPVVTISARNFAQSREDGVIDLEGVELRLYHKDGQHFDRVRSAKVQFDRNAGALYSEGDVEVLMGLPTGEKPQGRVLHIRSSGVRFDARTGRVETSRQASFQLDLGGGEAVGAAYDPTTRELELNSAVRLNWNPKKPGRPALRLETENLLYKERESQIVLHAHSRLTRASMTLEAEKAVVQLEEGVIRMVEASAARGADHFPNRNLQYEAAELRMFFDDDGAVTKISAERNARLAAASSQSRTLVSGDRVDLTFRVEDGESVLEKAVALGHVTAESRPEPQAKTPPQDTRVLRCEALELRMRPGGREMERMETHSPGRLDFLPNRPGQPRRQLEAERMTIEYGADNRIRRYIAVKASTKTWRALRKKGDPEVAATWSGGFVADFDPQDGQLSKIEQWDHFRYEEGARHATSDHAWLDGPLNQIRLEGRARAWDSTGATSAERIMLDQKTGDFAAEGSASFARMPEKSKPNRASGGLLTENEPLQATAQRIRSSDSRSVIRYEGNAVLWQGANRLRADVVVLRRKEEILNARGDVYSQFLDQSAPKKKEGILTTVRAQELLYTGEKREAWYQGGIELRRAELQIRARELRAWFKEGDRGGSSLDRALAQGAVQIVHEAPGRRRRGTAEEAEYDVAEQRVILWGGSPQLDDTLRGTTTGRKLTWWASDDRLLVDGVPAEPVRSMIRRGK